MFANMLILAAALAVAAPAFASEKTPVLTTKTDCTKERKGPKNSASKECTKQGKAGSDDKSDQKKGDARK